MRVVVAFYLLLGLAVPLPARPEGATGTAANRPTVASIADSIRTHMDYLAGDTLQGRGSGTPQEKMAADYVAGELRRYGVGPAGDKGGYLQQVALEYRSLGAPPVLTFDASGQEVHWTHGKDMAVAWLGRPEISGPLQRIDGSDANARVKPAAVVLLTPAEEPSPWQQAYQWTQRGAAMVIVPDGPAFEDLWGEARQHLPTLSPHIKRLPETGEVPETTMLVVRDHAAKVLASIPEGTTLRLQCKLNSVQTGQTWNTLGILPGSDSALRDQAVLFSAHLDHLGVRFTKNGKQIYHGADDDASGVSAVLELARAMAAAPRPRRTVLFAFFGSEERGGLGSTYFREYPPVPLAHIVAGLEFEMLGRPDKALPEHMLWLSGYERSDLGSELAAHNAPLVADPHPTEHFFERSDNYPLARKGVIAHTVSSYGLHRDYHRPSDDLKHIDFPHLTQAVESMIPPAEWLANSDFKPHWLPGEKP